MALVGDTPSRCLILIVCAVIHVTNATDPESCANKFNVHDDKIIQTEDSMKLGAKFIDSVEQRNRLECLELCCRTERCNVFVFEEKVNAHISPNHDVTLYSLVK